MAAPAKSRDGSRLYQVGTDAAKSLGCCLRRSPATDVWAADYGCILVHETLDCSGESRRFEDLDQVEDFLVKREQTGA